MYRNNNRITYVRLVLGLSEVPEADIFADTVAITDYRIYIIKSLNITPKTKKINNV